MIRQYLKFDFILPSLIFLSGLGYYYFFRNTTALAHCLGIESNKSFLAYAHYFNWFPTFVHIFFFSYITWLLLERKFENITIIFWGTINLVFELFQNGSPFLSFMLLPTNAQTIFLNSTFSFEDVAAVFFGAFAVKLYISFISSNIKRA